MNVVGIQMPPDADEKSLYEEVLGALDARIHYGHTASQMRRTARDLMTFVDARMLIIDETSRLVGRKLPAATALAECDTLSCQ
jgi:Bacterial TniB protein